MTKGLHYFGGGSTVCAQCGYRFTKGDDAIRIRQTGDIIHTDCFIDYSEDNREELTEEFEF